MASEEHRTENRLKPQSIYKQTVVANEHLTHVAASQVQMRAGIKENQERDFLDEYAVKHDRILRSSLPNKTFVALQYPCPVLRSMAIGRLVLQQRGTVRE
jgi:hypothetical protein